MTAEMLLARRAVTLQCERPSDIASCSDMVKFCVRLWEGVSVVKHG